MNVTLKQVLENKMTQTGCWDF